MNDHHDQIERQRLENENARLHNRLNAALDVINAAQHLADAVHLEGNPTTGSVFGNAYANLRAALRNYYQPNGR